VCTSQSYYRDKEKLSGVFVRFFSLRRFSYAARADASFAPQPAYTCEPND
jgi:hypothetical protein